MIKKWIAFAKKETVLCAALALALISSCLVLPDRKYLEYIDFRTLAILFGLMSVMGVSRRQECSGILQKGC